jgi:hypothetical protein
MNNTAYCITGTGKISIYIDGRSYTVETDHPNYKKIIEGLRDGQDITSLINISESIEKYSDGVFNVKNGQVVVEGQVIDNTLTKRILKFMADNLPYKPLLLFLENLTKNPSKRSVQELYDFLEFGELPITDDGCFLAFKNVDGNYWSIAGNPSIKPLKGKSDEQGRIYHGIGEEIEIRRNQVDDNKDVPCSTGLHFCSVKYLPHYSATGGKTIVVKVNPKDVVSIPSDYNNTKGRACAYTVLSDYVGDIPKAIQENRSGFSGNLYSSQTGKAFGTKPSGHKFWNVRNEKGQFVKSNTTDNEDDSY